MNCFNFPAEGEQCWSTRCRVLRGRGQLTADGVRGSNTAALTHTFRVGRPCARGE